MHPARKTANGIGQKRGGKNLRIKQKQNKGNEAGIAKSLMANMRILTRVSARNRCCERFRGRTDSNYYLLAARQRRESFFEKALEYGMPAL